MINKNFVTTYGQYDNVFIKKSMILICVASITGCSTSVVNQVNEINAVPIEGKYKSVSQQFNSPMNRTVSHGYKQIKKVAYNPKTVTSHFKPAQKHVATYNSKTIISHFKPTRQYVDLQKRFPIAKNPKYINKIPNQQVIPTSVKYRKSFRYQPAFNVYDFQRYYQLKGIVRSFWNANYGKYGMTRRSKYGTTKKHNGVDIVGNIGDNVYAVVSGIAEVSPTGTSGKLGIYVRIKDRNGYRTDHAHLSQVAVTNGTWVNTGDLIGYIGKTGNVPAHITAHVHISCWQKINGKQSFIDPTQLVFGNIINNPYSAITR